MVLGAGFAADAARAAYEALVAAVIALLDTAPPPGHASLVAAVYRELLPKGRLPAGAHAALATLHDLTSLDAQGVAVDVGVAASAVEESEQWVARLCDLGVPDGAANGLGEHHTGTVARPDERVAATPSPS